MVMLRVVAVCICVGLLSGCATRKDIEEIKADFIKELTQYTAYSASCSFPGDRQPELKIPGKPKACYYVLTITKAEGNSVLAKVADRAVDRMKKDKQNMVYPTRANRPEFHFQLQNSQKLTPGSDYIFDGVPNTTLLSCRKNPCEAVTTELP